MIIAPFTPPLSHRKPITYHRIPNHPITTEEHFFNCTRSHKSNGSNPHLPTPLILGSNFRVRPQTFRPQSRWRAAPSSVRCRIHKDLFSFRIAGSRSVGIGPQYIAVLFRTKRSCPREKRATSSLTKLCLTGPVSDFFFYFF
ncbi:hypothetical protein TNCT_142021 [Trichonephila clavata]|uniref:Uncharacterized protein n=1 Tax=Trichonephila clavata TaxID=2740835 RepID=A0A8X6KC96_TRICU|nr:hypothetical protein TNCT_142021 [Trichonephila clavata]